MINLEVGKKYPAEYRYNGIRLEYKDGFTLQIFLPDINQKEALTISKGKYRFALSEVKGILFFLSEFKGAIDMSDSPFHFGLYTDDRYKNLPDAIEEGEGFGLNVIAVDSRSGIVKALRTIGLSHNFSVRLLEICKRQAKEFPKRDEYEMKLTQIQNTFEASELYNGAEIKCEG